MDKDSTPARPIVEEDLHAWVDNMLDAARRREVQDHLDRHPEAAQQVAAFAAQRQALRAAFAGIADEPVPARLNLERLIDAQQRSAPHGARWRLAAAVLLAFGLGGFGGWAARGSGPGAALDASAAGGGIAALAREATSSYAVYAADRLRPVEMGADQRGELIHWVSERLQRPVAVPDLTASGYRFIGGRLVSTEHGPAGMFLYDDARGTRLAMLVRPMAREGNTPMMKRSDGGVAGYTWADRGLGYSVVGTERAETLHPLADEVRRQVGATL